MDWASEVKKISPYILRIRTQNGWGTGFVFWQNKTLCCIATAKHVIKQANISGWEQPIYLDQKDGNSVRLNPEHRRIIDNLNAEIDGDSASILIYKSGLNIPEQCLPLWDFSREIPIGTQLGWLGYPQVVDQSILTPSFFSGALSNTFPHLEQFAIDGVAIGGVSGSPIFCKLNDDSPNVIGTISAYFPNRVHGQGGIESLPGISVSHSFSAFIPVIQDLNNLDQIEQNET
jgi:hypothetical protein